ncbi:hypothetical protein [Pantoea agglomerans]|uniref:hypothetical protein n=1 Tax=Enterobacter agglomerans TaxID=549 RepID=UPI0028A084E7|nr:hypothetical protein [Pantoea agglomerans]WNK42611.1 hypothetical protein RM160_23600 [Pantoea agglomerans]
MHTLSIPTSFSIKTIISASCSAAISLWGYAKAGNRDEEWITNRAGSLSFKVQVHQLPSGKWTSGILTRSGTFHGNHRFSALNQPCEEFRSYRQARRFALKLANQMATLRYAYQ